MTGSGNNSSARGIDLCYLEAPRIDVGPRFRGWLVFYTHELEGKLISITELSAKEERGA